MATGIVGQHQITTFVTPVNGTSPIDANQCRGNDNTIKTLYDAHDVDATIHFQSSDLASRPAASIAGQKWMTSDAYRIYYDDGAAWHEAAYLPSTGGTVSGNVVITGTLRVNGAATFDTNVTISSGTLAAQAVTATSVTTSGAGGITVQAGGITVSAGVSNLQDTKFGGGNFTLSKLSRTNGFVGGGTIATGTSSLGTFTISGASVDDIVFVSGSGFDYAGVQVWGHVTAANTITVYATNQTGSGVAVSGATIYVTTLKGS